MSHTTTESARVINVAAGVENTDRTALVRDGRHQALAVLIGRWINESRRINATPLRPGLIPGPACPGMKNAGNLGAGVAGEKVRAGGHVPLASYP